MNPLVLVGLLILQWALASLLAPKAKANEVKPPQGFEFPHSNQAVPIPIFWGKVRIRSPVVILAKLYRADPIKQKAGGDNITIGYTYRLAMQFLLGAPGKRTLSPDKTSSLTKFWIGERIVWSGETFGGADIRYVQKRTLFGGHKQGGGVEGFIMYHPGSRTQTNARFLRKALTKFGVKTTLPYRDQAVVSLFGASGDGTYATAGFNNDGQPRGVYFKDGVRIDTSSLVLVKEQLNGSVVKFTAVRGQLPPIVNSQMTQTILGRVDTGESTSGPPPYRLIDTTTICGWMVGEAPTLDGYSFEAFARSDVTYTGHGNIGIIGGEDANPVNALYDLITNPWDRVGRDPSTIDLDSFYAAAATTHAEGNGFSLVVASTVDSKDVVQLILQQLGAVLYDDCATGTYKIKLIRADYDEDDIPELDPSNVIEVVSYSAGLWSDTYNQVHVTFTSRARDYTDAPAVAQDLANWDAQREATGAEGPRTKYVTYPGCTTQSNADKLAARDLKAVSLPLAKLRIAVDRSSWDLRPGDVFKFTWPEFDGMSDKVFRVMTYDLGHPGKGGAERIVLDCIEDRFAANHKVFTGPRAPNVPFDDVRISTEHERDESPYWLQVRAELLGKITDADRGGRRYYLATPRLNAESFRVDLSFDGVSYAADIEDQPFPGRAELQADYSRTLEPYDTTTGITIGALADWTPAVSATTDEISKLGKSLIKIDDEIISYGTATDNGDGTWLLENLGRGLLDTVPAAHGAGARVWNLSDEDGANVSRVGRISLDYGQTPITRLVASGVGQVAKESAAPAVDGTTARATSLRHVLPYPPADVLISCESAAIGDTPGKAPAQLVEGGYNLSWTRRSRLSTTIKRGDGADEDPEADTTYKVYGRGYDEYGEIASAAGLSSSVDYTGTSIDGAMVGRIGYGTLSVGVLASAPLRSADPAAPLTAGALFVPAFDVDAPDWRNLLRNGRFDQDLDGWTTDAGEPVAATGSGGLGGGLYYLYSSGEDDTAIHQVVDVTGFIAGHCDAYLLFSHIGDGGDTCTVTLTALDSGDATLDSVDTGTVIPSATVWNRRQLTFLDLPEGTTKLRVDVEVNGVGGGPAIKLTEFVLRLGQPTTQLLTNPDFESGFTGWTNVTNSFAVTTSTPLYIATQYARPGDFASSEIKQEVSVPTGFGAGATAVLEFARNQKSGEADTGEVVLEAFTVDPPSGSPYASATTGAEVISPAGVWQRRRLVVPFDITDSEIKSLRVRLIGTRVDTTECSTYFDDFDLRVLRYLDPVAAKTQFTELDVPAAQPSPPDLDYWDRSWPDVTAPTLGFWAGARNQGMLGYEPPLVSTDAEASAPATPGGTFTGCYDAERGGAVVTDCFDFPPSCDAGLAVDSSIFADFSLTDPFTVLLQLKVASEDPTNYVLVSRVGTYGFELALKNDASGVAVARLIGVDGTVEAEGTVNLCDRAVRMVAMVYDPTADELRLVDQAGETVTSSASDAGEFQDESPVQMKVGEATGNGGAFLTGQVSRLWMWDIAMSTADIQTLMTHGGAPDPHVVQSSSGGTLATVIGVDDSGDVIVARFGTDQCAYAWSAELEGDDETGLGYPQQFLAKNRIAEIDQAQATGDWHTAGGATVALNPGRGPEGFPSQFSVTGTNAQGRELQSVLAGAAADMVVGFFARADVAHTARLALNNASDVNKGNFDFAVTTEWQVFFHHFTTWDDSTPTCRLRWCGSSTGSSGQVEIAGPLYLSQTGAIPVAIPVGASDSTDYGRGAEIQGIGTDELGRQHTLEGEIQVTGVAAEAAPDVGQYIFEISVGHGASDLRTLFQDGGQPSFEHDATDTSLSQAAAQSWDSLWTVRGRWSFGGLADDLNVYAGVLFGDENGDPADYNRTAPWTDTGVELEDARFGSSIGDTMAMIVRRVVVRTRERRLPFA